MTALFSYINRPALLVNLPVKALKNSVSAPAKYRNRKEEIYQTYLSLIDTHLLDVVAGRVEEMFELQDFASALFIHPTHFSNVVKEHTGYHPCYFYEQKLLLVAKGLLNDSNHSIADVARILTYDPSNFTKWFKTFAKITPSQYRKQLAHATSNTETVTI